MICIAATGRVPYHVAFHAPIGLIKREMDQPQSAASTSGSLQAKGCETEPIGGSRQGVGAGDLGRGNPGKAVGAVVAAAKVLRILHGSERPLNASEVARAAGLHRGTAYNILRTLQAEGFVGYDEATRSTGKARTSIRWRQTSWADCRPQFSILLTTPRPASALPAQRRRTSS
jgi:hypothetical protein